MAHIRSAIKESVNPSLNSVVNVQWIADLKSECEHIKIICDQYNVQLILFSKHGSAACCNYGCGECVNNFPNTLDPNYERRTWRLIEDDKIIYKNILVIDDSGNLAGKFNFVIQEKSNSEYYLILNNVKYTMDLINLLGIDCRKFK